MHITKLKYYSHFLNPLTKTMIRPYTFRYYSNTQLNPNEKKVPNYLTYKWTFTDKLTKDLTDKLTTDLTDKLTKDLTKDLTNKLTNDLTKDLTNKLTNKLTNTKKLSNDITSIYHAIFWYCIIYRVF